MEESKSPPSTGSSANYAMPDVVPPPRKRIAETENIEENIEENFDETMVEDGPSEDIPPAVAPKRRMTLKPKKQQVTEP
jgi:hypothetical protein